MTSFASLTLLYESRNNKNTTTCSSYFCKTLWTVSCILSPISSKDTLTSLEEFELYLVEKTKKEVVDNEKEFDNKEFTDVIEVFKSNSSNVDTTCYYYIEMNDVKLINKLSNSNNGSNKNQYSNLKSISLSVTIDDSIINGLNDDIDLLALKQCASQIRWMLLNKTGGEFHIEDMLSKLASSSQSYYSSDTHINASSSTDNVLSDDINPAEVTKSGFVTPKLNNKTGGGGVFNFSSTNTSSNNNLNQTTNPLQHIVDSTLPNTALEARLLHEKMHILSFNEQDMDLTGHCSNSSIPNTNASVSTPALSNFDLPSLSTYPSSLKKQNTTIRPYRLPLPNADLTRAKRAAFLQQRRSNNNQPQQQPPRPFSFDNNIPPTLEIITKIQASPPLPDTTTALFDPFATNISTSQSDSPISPHDNTNANDLFPPTSTISNSSTIPSPSQQHNQLIANIAINEDLTCSYKQSKLYSSTIEGVVQLQIKSSSTDNNKMMLLNDNNGDSTLLLIVNDKSNHIDTLHENRQIAIFQDNNNNNNSDTMKQKSDVSSLPKSEVESSTNGVNTSSSSESNNNDTSNQHIFKISIPKPDQYFPVLRYKCIPSLRPVPIRVQTRIRLKEDYIRVALQISSNPSNSDNLTDLSIIMRVPSSNKINGDTLITSPEGGIWCNDDDDDDDDDDDNDKPYVLWGVSEIGKGEKFHLQAQFQICYENIENNDNNDDDGIANNNSISHKDLIFPVEVKCQCMYAQLSDVEFQVQSLLKVEEDKDVPSSSSSDDNNAITTKIARRFRLSHFENS